MKKKGRKRTPEERAEADARAEYLIRKLREYATRRPGTRERLEGMQD